MIISIAAGNAGGQAITNLLDAGSPPGLLKIFTGSAPATPETADSGTLLFSTTLGNPAFGTFVGGVGTANAITAGTAAATGTAGYARLYNAAATCVLQLTVGTSSADLVLNTLSFISGEPVSITSATFTMPSS